MTKTEEARFSYLENIIEDKTKLEFLVRTGLTFDPKAKRMFNGEEKEYKDIDWYYPKGAAFETPEETPSDEPATTQQNIDDAINNNDVTVNQSDGEGGTTSSQLDPTSTVEPITVDDGDDDDTNDETLATSDGEIIIGNDEP